MIIVCQKCGHHNPHDSVVERFWNQVDKSGECWEWVGYTSESGYAKITINANGDKMAAHRFAYEMANGPIPEGMVVCHSCDNPTCVRHDHLFLGTAADNTFDKVKKGRQSKGEHQPHSKLTDEKVLEMRKEYAAGGISYAELGKKYGVSKQCALRAVKGIGWKHI